MDTGAMAGFTANRLCPDRRRRTTTDILGDCYYDYAWSEDLIEAPRQTTGLSPNHDPRRCAMANKDQKNRSANNKPKLSMKEKKERKERKAAAKQRDR